ncbi:MAG: SDR family oxidoreductase [Planctomycetes bacterium]|nr:SDR family oxidoreductase [Planctomycetota bacterium]MCD7896042.1 SDR family oxidoreductase [Planctomycetaceae bacterium]
MFDLTGKIAMVTGAGSPRGIGRSIALGLAEQGAKVVLADIDANGLETVAQDVRKVNPDVLTVVMNILKPDEIQAAVDKVVATWGRLDILVNNAGVTQAIRVLDMTEADWDRVVDINMKGTFFVTKTVLPQMLKQGYGRIVNMSSVSGKRGGGVFGGAHYSAAKAGILAFGKALSREVAAKGITINAVAPGMVATDIRGGLESEEDQKKMTMDVLMNRMATPAEVAACVAFLASDEAAYITGEEIDLNGGSHMD